MVKELREMTGAGMMDCKKALSETNGDMDAAVEFLRKNGQAKAEKKMCIRDRYYSVPSDGFTGFWTFSPGNRQGSGLLCSGCDLSLIHI